MFNRYSILWLIGVWAIASSSFAQTESAVFKWTITAKKIADKKYELILQSAAAKNTALYVPGYDLDGVNSATLSFNDSSIGLLSFTAHQTPTQPPATSIFSNKNIRVSMANNQWQAIVQFNNKVPAQLIGKLEVFYSQGDAFLPDLPFEFSTALEGGETTGMAIKRNAITISNPVNNCGDNATGSKKMLSIFLLGLLGGLIALLTPCVFPMVPVTVTFFTKKSQGRSQAISNAVLYGLFIFLIYVAITIPFHVASKTISPEIFNNISTNVWLNFIFFGVFVVFALSFFGLFEIVLPASLANNADSKSGLGNIAGIFFMAATLAIVSFSCTGPLLGTLLANVANEGPWPLTAGAAGFGLALGLPFALFALFPNWLQKLPKSGGWMTDVKVVLGFVELALAIKFLANADNVMQWGLLKREIFIACWIVIGLLIVLYLTGKITIAHSSPVKKYTPARLFFIAVFAGFTIYLVPGLFNSRMASLSLMSGFPPPLSYSIYNPHVLMAEGVKPLHNDYEKALAMAKAQNKPLLIDFTGWACVNCRRMEEKVWPDAAVSQLMKEKFVVLSLYVDEKTKLPATAQSIYTGNTGTAKKIVTVGDLWSTFQTENFGATSQPQYAIIDGNEKALTKTKFYTPDAKEFANWLKCGLQAFDKK
jgi:cytochrome c biogenesis protein CcdA/thioredoxin-related protein